MNLKMTDLFRAELEREAAATRRVLERVPEGRGDWKPHEKSMRLYQLATLVATMPSWVTMTVQQDELDFNPPGGRQYKPQELQTNRELVEALDGHVAKAVEALSQTADEHLMTTWKFLTGGKLIKEDPRYIVLRDGVMNHWAHHRGQLTVFLRLTNTPVPAIYGPSADEARFA